MGIPFTGGMGFLFTVTMGKLFTMTLGIQLTVSTRAIYCPFNAPGGRRAVKIEGRGALGPAKAGDNKNSGLNHFMGDGSDIDIAT